MKTVDYEKQTLDNPNPIARYAHRTRFARSKKVVLARLREQETIVDYGCGQGKFLHELNGELDQPKMKCHLYGYDPYMKAKFDGYEVVSDPNIIEDDSVRIITCLEVCEHLDEDETQEFIDFSLAKLKKGGTLLVTVPIMVGPAVILKELSRMFLYRRWTNIFRRDVLMASFFGVVPPRAKNIKVSHGGYNWRVTLDSLKKNFEVEKVEFSPLKPLGWYGNSQAFFILRKA